MSGTHYTVKRGDCLSSIAHTHGFRNWKLIYEAPENADLRRRRPNPNVLHPGDVLYIPEKKVKHRDVGTGAIHRHVVSRPKWKLRVVLKDQRGDPLADLPYELSIDSLAPVRGKSGSDGLIECGVPPDARRGVLRYLGESHVLELGHLDPVIKTTGLQGRLANLGFDPGPVDGIYGHRTARAVYGFQLAQGLRATGNADDATRARLLAVHDGDDRTSVPEDEMALPDVEPSPAPAAAGVLLAPVAEENEREIVIVGAQAAVGDGDHQELDDVSMNFVKAALSLQPDASNSGETIFYVHKSGLSKASRVWLQEHKGWATSLHFFSNHTELAQLLGAWPPGSVARLTIIAHGYPDHIKLHDGDDIDAAFFAGFGRLFAPRGTIVSHACRTGDAELAQQIASQAGVAVYAWTGRTSYAHKNPDKSLTDVHPSRIPDLTPTLSARYVANLWEGFKELKSRHFEADREPQFLKFVPGVEGARP